MPTRAQTNQESSPLASVPIPHPPGLPGSSLGSPWPPYKQPFLGHECRVPMEAFLLQLQVLCMLILSLYLLLLILFLLLP